MEYINRRMNDLQHEIENSLRSHITDTTIAVVKWYTGDDYKDCETISELRDRLFEEYGLATK